MSLKNTRRDFLRMTTTMAGVAMLPASIRRALAIPPDNRTGTIRDVEHIVILMQENRSFDHYFGTMRGVRGFSDPRPMLLPDGKPIWYQPPARVQTKHYKNRGLRADATHVLPWYINPKRTTEHQAGTDHGWASGHGAWNHGHWNAWVTQKQDVLTMGYLRRQDVSFHFALAEAFTLCDAYFCSVHADTCPNRIYLWTGTCDPRNVMGRKQNGPGLWERSKTDGYTWTTYPERLERAGISWKLYQGGTGEPGKPTDNYTDNSLEFFSAYQVKEGADPNGPLVQKGVTNHTLKEFRNDIITGKLAQVTWIVAPYKYCEHPEASPTDGAYFIHKVLEALTENTKVWSRTVLFVNYDENDGLFDHVVPPMPPLSSEMESGGMVSNNLKESLKDELLDLDRFPIEEHPLIPGHISRGMQPIGLGPRVPMIVVSPWSQGGWVCSQVFDHTSVLRFLEVRFGVQEPNISAWRRAVCGDLTAAFDFSNHSDGAMAHFTVPKPVATLHRPYHVPGEQQMPRQEAGTRKSRTLPYLLMVNGHGDPDKFHIDKFYIEFTNSGQVGAAFSVHDGTQPESPPRRYAVSAGDQLRDAWRSEGDARHYDLTVYGPHGYLRQFRGDLASLVAEAKVSYIPGHESVLLSLTNEGTQPVNITVTERYTTIRQEVFVPSGEVQQHEYHLENSFGWYDLSITSDEPRYLRRFAGHVESGRPSTSDPATYSDV
jgi:phospholipase C